MQSPDTSKPFISQSEQSADTNNAVFREIADLNKDFIYVIDSDGSIVFANKTLCDLFPQADYQQVLSIHTPIAFEAVPVDASTHYYPFPLISNQAQRALLQRVKEAKKTALKDGSHTRIEHLKIEEDAQLVLEVSTQRFKNYREDAHLLVTCRDVTDRELIIEDLQRSNTDLDSFAYVASHDLKAPLNVIKRMVTWVMEDCHALLPKDSIENLEIVMSRANRMEQLLKDLLSYARIGKEYQAARELNIKEKVLELLSLMDLPMGFVVNCDDEKVRVPEVPFSVVLLNLIANSIKHHDLGNAKIEIKARQTRKANIITVMDNGPGISEENRTKIFELFETLKPRDDVEGSGMGLSVVKRLVEHYGGNIKVDENLPRGAKFIVYWPFTNKARQVLTRIRPPKKGD